MQKQKDLKPFRAISVCGPSGSGKTTVCRALADISQVYLEDVHDNPYLPKLLDGSGHFDAAANQQWFLDRISQFIQLSQDRPIVLDQDPSAIVLAYSRVFHEDGLITAAQYESLMRSLVKIEEMLRRWETPRIVFCLDAPANVLRIRVARRSGELRTAPLAWFDRVRDHFLELYARLPNATTISTVDLSPEQVASRARALVESGSHA